jgi:hypothetical protein
VIKIERPGRKIVSGGELKPKKAAKAGEEEREGKHEIAKKE